MYLGESELPEIVGAFESGTIGSEAAYETDPTLPRISGFFERGTVSSKVPSAPEPNSPYYEHIFEQGTLDDNIGQTQHFNFGQTLSFREGFDSQYDSLPNISGYFEGGSISDNTFRVKDQSLPAISGLFEGGRLGLPFNQETVAKSTHLSQIPGHFEGGFVSEPYTQQDLPQTGEFSIDNLSPWNISEQFSPQTLEFSPRRTQISRSQRFFSESSPIDSQRRTLSFDVSQVETPDFKGTSSSFQSFPQQSFDSGLGQHIWPEFSLPTSGLYGSDPNRSFQESGSGLNSNDWVHDLLSQSTPGTAQDLWSRSLFAPPQQDFTTQSSQPSSLSLKPDDWTQNIFDQSILTSVPHSVGTDIFQHLSQEVDSYANSRSINEDITLMATKGFIVEPNIKSQFTGALLQGWFGPEIRYQKDIRCQPFRDSDVGQPFIVKFIEFKETDLMSDTKRQMFEIEKFILTFAEHQNIVSIRYAFNMGQNRQCKYRHNPCMTFTSWDRQYLILEFADLGDLETYLEDNILSEELCISFIHQLYSGLKYLHDSYIFHGDIEPRNILLFKTGVSDITVKWCDFGIGCILNGNHPSQPNTVQTERVIEYLNYDLECLAKIFQQILMFSTSSGECSQYIQQIIDLLRSGTDLNQIKPMIDILSSKYSII